MAPTFTDAQADKIREQFRCFMNALGISQRRAARLVSVGETSLSALLNGSYSGDEAVHLAKIQGFLDREAERQDAPLDRKFVETTIAKNILHCLRQNHVHGTIGQVIGDAGRGKTMAFHEYTLRNPGTYLVSASRWVRTPGQLARQLVALTQRKTSKTMKLNDASLFLIDEFKGQSSLLIIDQAHQLTVESFEFVQNLWDELNNFGDSRFGIVMGGTKRLEHQLTRDSDKYLFEQLNSRIDVGVTAVLDRPFTEDDIRKVFAVETIQFALEDAAVRELLKIANTKSLRTAVASIKHIVEVFNKKKLTPREVKISAQHLETARSVMSRAA